MARARRPAEETKRAIIAVAQGHLMDRGPDGLRLNDVAAELGVSRQAILHHFGSRSGLMRAVVEQAWLGLFADVSSLAGSADGMAPDAFVDHVDEVVRKRGNARLGAWLLLSDEGLAPEMFDGVLSNLPDSMSSEPEARFKLLLIGAALFGDAIFGVRLRQAFGLKDSEEDRLAFRRWLAGELWRSEVAGRTEQKSSD